MSQVRLVIAGYYGCGNLGDDALLWGLVSQLNPQEYSVTVLTGDLDLTQKALGVNAVQRKNMKAVKQAIQNSDALVFAGGSLFQDVTSVRSVAYYAQLVKYARRSKKKVILLGQGLGPLQTWLGRSIAIKALSKADAIAMRDLDSIELLKELYVKAPVGLTADLAYLLEPQAQKLLIKKNPEDPKTIGIAPRFLKRNKNDMLVEFFAEIADQLAERGYRINWISMHPDEELETIEAIRKRCNSISLVSTAVSTPQALLQEFASLDGLIGMRLHAGIFATLFNIAPYMISYDPKVEAFSNSLGLPFGSCTDLNSTAFTQSFVDFFENRQQYQTSFEQKRNALIQQSKINLSVLSKSIS